MVNKKIKTELLIPTSKNDGSVPWKSPARDDNSAPLYYFSDKYGINEIPIIWKKNEIFKAGIKFYKILQTSSTVLILVKNTETDIVYNIRYADFEEIMKKTTWVFGICVGEWKYRNFNNHVSIVTADTEI